MKKIGRAFSLFFLIFSVWINQASIAVAAGVIGAPTVVVKPNPVSESESIQLRIEVETELSTVLYQPTFDAPDFLVIGSGPQVYGNPPVRKFIAGKEKTTTKRIFEFVLSPKRSGILWIRNIQFKAGDESIRTQDVMVKVLEDKDGASTNGSVGNARGGSAGSSSSGSRQNGEDQTSPNWSGDEEDEQGNPAAPGFSRGGSNSVDGDLPARFNSDFTVHANISKKSAYVGEPIVIEYWLYDFGGLQEIEVQKWPSFNGFWKEDLEITNQFRFESLLINNEIGRRAFISRYALYGLRPGKFRLDRLNIRGAYVSRMRGNGFFLAQQRRIGTHGSQDIEIEVLPLPTEGRPTPFSGAVGSFQLQLESEKSIVPQHSPVTFTLTLSGEGNFQSVDAIPIPLPPGFEVYDSKSGARGTTPLGMRKDLSSQKVFQVTAIPRSAGKFTIAPIEWNYFDPKKKTYEKLVTKPLEIEVTESAMGANPTNQYLSNGSTPGANGASGDAAQNQISLLLSKDGIFQAISWRKSILALLVVILLVNIVLVYRWYRSSARNVVLDFLKDPLAEAKEEFQKGKGSKDVMWANHFEEALFSMGEVLLNTNPRGVPRSEFEALWREQKLPAPLFHQMALVLDQLDQLRFTGKKSNQEMAQLKGKLERQISEIFQGAKGLSGK